MADQKTADTVDYEVTQAREIAGAYRKVGDIIQMKPGQAKYYLPPHGAGLKQVAGAAGKPKVEAENAGSKTGKIDI